MSMTNPFSETASFRNRKEIRKKPDYFGMVEDLRRRVEGLGPKTDVAPLKKEVRGLLLRIHPDVYPGDVTMEKVARIATQVLDAYRDQATFDDEQRSKLLSQIRKLEQDETVQSTRRPAVQPPIEPKTVEDVHHGQRAWRPAAENPENEIPPYEVVDYSFGEHLMGRKIYEVAIELSRSQIDKLFNREKGFSQSGGRRPMQFFQVEGVEGVLVPMKNYVGEHRVEFGGWKLIKAIPAKQKGYLGVMTGFERYKRRLAGNRSDVGTRIGTNIGEISVGDMTDTLLGYEDTESYCHVRMQAVRGARNIYS